jgi:hypothetical protein
MSNRAEQQQQQGWTLQDEVAVQQALALAFEQGKKALAQRAEKRGK